MAKGGAVSLCVFQSLSVSRRVEGHPHLDTRLSFWQPHNHHRWWTHKWENTHWYRPLINSGRVGWLYNNCLCGSHSWAYVCFFSGEGEVCSLLMLACWPTSVSFIPAATEGAEPKRKKKKIRLISLTPCKSNKQTLSHKPQGPQVPAAIPATRGTDEEKSAQLSIPKYGQPTPAGLSANVANCVAILMAHLFPQNMKCILTGCEGYNVAF